MTDEVLVGTWQEKSAGWVFARFNPDGTYVMAEHINYFEEMPAVVGTYKLEGTSLELTSEDAGLNCNEGETGTYQVDLTKEGILVFTEPIDGCKDRQHAFGDYNEWIRVED